MSTTLGSKDIEIRKVEFVTKTQFLYKKINIIYKCAKTNSSVYKSDTKKS